jgi:hypothetical protein
VERASGIRDFEVGLKAPVLVGFAGGFGSHNHAYDSSREVGR